MESNLFIRFLEQCRSIFGATSSYDPKAAEKFIHVGQKDILSKLKPKQYLELMFAVLIPVSTQIFQPHLEDVPVLSRKEVHKLGMFGLLLGTWIKHMDNTSIQNNDKAMKICDDAIYLRKFYDAALLTPVNVCGATEEYKTAMKKPKAFTNPRISGYLAMIKALICVMQSSGVNVDVFDACLRTLSYTLCRITQDAELSEADRCTAAQALSNDILINLLSIISLPKTLRTVRIINESGALLTDLSEDACGFESYQPRLRTHRGIVDASLLATWNDEQTSLTFVDDGVYPTLRRDTSELWACFGAILSFTQVDADLFNRFVMCITLAITETNQITTLRTVTSQVMLDTFHAGTLPHISTVIAAWPQEYLCANTILTGCLQMSAMNSEMARDIGVACGNKSTCANENIFQLLFTQLDNEVNLTLLLHYLQTLCTGDAAMPFDKLSPDNVLRVIGHHRQLLGVLDVSTISIRMIECLPCGLSAIFHLLMDCIEQGDTEKMVELIVNIISPLLRRSSVLVLQERYLAHIRSGDIDGATAVSEALFLLSFLLPFNGASEEDSCIIRDLLFKVASNIIRAVKPPYLPEEMKSLFSNINEYDEGSRVRLMELIILVSDSCNDESKASIVDLSIKPGTNKPIDTIAALNALTFERYLNLITHVNCVLNDQQQGKQMNICQLIHYNITENKIKMLEYIADAVQKSNNLFAQCQLNAYDQLFDDLVELLVHENLQLRCVSARLICAVRGYSPEVQDILEKSAAKIFNVNESPPQSSAAGITICQDIGDYDDIFYPPLPATQIVDEVDNSSVLTNLQLRGQDFALWEKNLRKIADKYDEKHVRSKIHDITLQDNGKLTSTQCSTMQSTKMILTKTTKHNILQVQAAVSKNIPLMLEGATGVGKSATIAEAAKMMNKKLIRFNMSSHINIDDLLGKISLDGNGNIKYQPQPFAEAWEHGYWILLDECNLASAAVLQSLELALETGVLIITDQSSAEQGSSRVIHRHPEFRLFATQNPNTGMFRGCRQPLSQSFVTRFGVTIFEALPPEEWEEIVALELEEIIQSKEEASSIAKLMVNIHMRIEDDAHGESGPHAIVTIRDLLKWTNLLKSTVSHKYDKQLLGSTCWATCLIYSLSKD